MKRDIYWGNSSDGVIEVAKQVDKVNVFKEMRKFIFEYDMIFSPRWSIFCKDPVIVDYGSWSYFFYIFGGDIINET